LGKATCPFYMEFLTDNIFHNTGFNYTLQSYVSQHNHELKKLGDNEKKTNKITTPVKDTIKEFAGKFKSSQELTDYVNKKHNLATSYNQIYYHQSRIYAEVYGQANKDCNLLIKTIEDEIQNGICKSNYLVNSENQLTHFIYSSLEMEQIYHHFNDVLIIDTTFKKNRFNMPLINFVSIDNYGFSRIVAFGLTHNEKQDTFEWVLRSFYDIMNHKYAKIVFTDEDDGLINGNDSKF